MTRARELSRLGNTNVLSVDSSNNVGINSTIPDAKLDVVGVVSATSFYGDGSELDGITGGATLSAGSGAQRVVVTSLTSGTMTAAATDADLSWNSSTNTLSAPTLSGNITGTSATFTGNVSIGGTLTYEDVTNIDSVGVITSRDGIKVGASQSISPVSGTLTYYGDGSNLDGVQSGVVNFVASGTIANGATVIIKDDGTVGIVTTTTSDAPSVGSEEAFELAEANWTSAAYDSTNDKVVIAYQDNGNSNYGTAVVGTVSGDTISFGTPVPFETASVTDHISCVFVGSGKVVIAYRDSGNSSHGTAIVGTVSSTSITFGNAVVFNSATVEYISSVYDSTNGKVVINYMDAGNSNKGTARVGTVSGTSISFGSEVVFADGMRVSDMTYDSTNGKVVIAYQDDQNSNYGTAIVGTVSGTDITFGNAAVFNSVDSTLGISCVFVGSGKVVIAYNDSGVARGECVVGTVSGTDITFGNAVVFESGAKADFISCAYDSTNDKVVIAYRDGGNSDCGTAIVGTVSGTDITFGTTSVYNSGGNTMYNTSTYDPDQGKIVVAYRDIPNSNYGTAVVLSSTSQVTNLTTDNYIGIAGEAISNAATGKVNVVGGVNSGQSGLTTNRKYYVGQSGILTTTADTPSVVAGTSVSDTEILVWKS